MYNVTYVVKEAIATARTETRKEIILAFKFVTMIKHGH